MARITLNPETKKISTVAHQLLHYASIVEINSWQEILDCYQQLKQQVTPKKVFLILDSESQAEYTSMHATEDERLYFDSDIFLQGIDINDPQWDAHYHNICLPKQLTHYIQQLSSPEHQKMIGDFVNKMQHYDDNDFKAIIHFNVEPLIVMDKSIVVKVAHVETDPLKLAMLPNGYFSCDFDPFENFSILKCLESYGFEFLGLGAALMGWIKTTYFKPEYTDNLMKDLIAIYHFSEDYQQQLYKLLMKNNYLILPYTESPQECAADLYQ